MTANLLVILWLGSQNENQISNGGQRVSEIWRLNATKLGEKLAKEKKVISLPVKPIDIAESQNIVVESLPSNKQGVSGMLVESNSSFGIMYATYIDNFGFQNFCIAHELGHYNIGGHYEQLIMGSGFHESKAGFVSGDRYELEADHFAAGLLMPNYLFDVELNKIQSGLKAVETLSERCETSLTATAIRYAQRSPDPIAIIMSEGQSILYCFMSDEMKEIRELAWIRKGTLLPKNTVTYHLNQSQSNVLSGERLEGESTLQDWFGCDLQYELYEEAIGLGQYGKTLTVLSLESIPDQEEIDEEDELEESWAPKFKR
jgi:hypothetical protein